MLAQHMGLLSVFTLQLIKEIGTAGTLKALLLIVFLCSTHVLLLLLVCIEFL